MTSATAFAVGSDGAGDNAAYRSGLVAVAPRVALTMGARWRSAGLTWAVSA